MIRPATPQDIPALLGLGARMHAESPHYSRIAFSAEKLAQTLQNTLSADGGFLWVGVVGGQVVGVMMGFAIAHWCSEELVASELVLFVERPHRGGLMGAKLISQFLYWARSLGAKLITAGVSTGVNAEKIAGLYEAMGMKRLGILLEA